MSTDENKKVVKSKIQTSMNMRDIPQEALPMLGGDKLPTDPKQRLAVARELYNRAREVEPSIRRVLPPTVSESLEAAAAAAPPAAAAVARAPAPAEQQTFHGEAIPFFNEEAQYALINIGGRFQVPKCTQLAFRICGGFPTPEKLTRHIKSAGGVKMFGNVNCFSVEIHKPFLLCQNVKNQLDVNYNNEERKKILDLYYEHLEASKREVQKNIDEKKSGEVGKSAFVSKKEEKTTSRTPFLNEKFEEHAKANPDKELQEFSRNSEVRNQTHAVITFIQDYRPDSLKGKQDKEGVLFIWAICRSLEEAKFYAKNVAADQVTKDGYQVSKFDLEIIDLYENCFPYNFNPELVPEEDFRNPTEAKIFQAKKANQANTKSVLQKHRPDLPMPTKEQTEVSNIKGDTIQITTLPKGTQPIQADQLAERADEFVPVVPQQYDQQTNAFVYNDSQTGSQQQQLPEQVLLPGQISLRSPDPASSTVPVPVADPNQKKQLDLSLPGGLDD